MSCALIGLLVGAPALRLTGLYLLLATLAAHYIIFYAANLYQLRTVGPAGFAMPSLEVLGWTPVTRSDWYIIMAVTAAVVLFIADNLLRRSPGRAWAAIRHKESVAAALGIPVTRFKILAFVISSAMIGLQGVLYAYFVGNVTIDLWDLDTAIGYIAMIVIGGLGSIGGSIVGAMLVTLLPFMIGNYLETTHGIPSMIITRAGFITTAIYGLLITLTLLVAPKGVAGAALSACRRIAVVVRRYQHE